MKLSNGFQQFPAVFNIQDLKVGDFQNDDFSQGNLSTCNCYSYSLIIIGSMLKFENLPHILHLLEIT